MLVTCGLVNLQGGTMGGNMAGGYVIVTKNENYQQRVTVDEQTLLQIARILDIPESDRERLASEFKSIFIYRDTKLTKTEPDS